MFKIWHLYLVGDYVIIYIFTSKDIIHELVPLQQGTNREDNKIGGEEEEQLLPSWSVSESCLWYVFIRV